MRQGQKAPESASPIVMIEINLKNTRLFGFNTNCFVGQFDLSCVFSQYVLELLGLHKKFDIVWTCILFPLGAIYTFFYIRRKTKKNNIPKTVLGTVIGAMGWLFGLNVFLLAAVFGDHIGNALAPVMMILLAITIMVIGLSIKYKPLIIGGIALNLLAFGTFLVDPKYYGFSIMLGAVIGLIIPGIILNIAKKKENV
jgi:hypothetical protein